MSVMVQVRDVPDAVHRRLKARAALEGLTISDFVLRELKRALDRPTREEMLARLAERRRGALRVAAAELLRRERDAR